MTRDAWLAKHPYLRPAADLQASIETTLTGIPIQRVDVSDWSNYVDSFHAGIPLLRSSSVEVDLHQVATVVMSLIHSLASIPSFGKLAEETRALTAELHRDSRSYREIAECLAGKDCHSAVHSGLIHYLGWTVLARYLRPLVDAFASWRNEEQWFRNYCPTCGARPAMAQLLGTDPGRLRFLSCGCCETRWRYRRTQCPFCETDEEHWLTVLTVEGETQLRIDYCPACSGYLKTYNGSGNEGVMLADWTSLHLDVIAHDRGLKRFAGSLYQLSGISGAT